jgi:hypothetical protein
MKTRTINFFILFALRRLLNHGICRSVIWYYCQFKPALDLVSAKNLKETFYNGTKYHLSRLRLRLKPRLSLGTETIAISFELVSYTISIMYFNKLSRFGENTAQVRSPQKSSKVQSSNQRFGPYQHDPMPADLCDNTEGRASPLRS